VKSQLPPCSRYGLNFPARHVVPEFFINRVELQSLLLASLFSKVLGKVGNDNNRGLRGETLKPLRCVWSQQNGLLSFANELRGSRLKSPFWAMRFLTDHRLQSCVLASCIQVSLWRVLLAVSAVLPSFGFLGAVGTPHFLMKARVEYRPYCVPFLRPVQTAHGLWRERQGVIVRWEDEGGEVGYAEEAPLSYLAVRRPFLLAKPRSRGLGGFLIPAPKDTSPREVAALLPAGRAALAALRVRRTEGFRVLKWKVGIARDPSEELDVLEELCAELPDCGKVRLDANGGWTQRVAEQWLARCAEPRLAQKIEFIEQPVWAGKAVGERYGGERLTGARHNASGGSPQQRRVDDVLLGLAADYPIPLALDESVASDADLRRWMERGWCGVFVVKPTLLAEPAAVFGELARAKARVVFSSAMETAIGAKAALRWAFAWEGDNGAGDPLALGFGVYPLFRAAVFNGPRAQPFLRWEDVQEINEEVLWNALA